MRKTLARPVEVTLAHPPLAGGVGAEDEDDDVGLLALGGVDRPRPEPGVPADALGQLAGDVAERRDRHHLREVEPDRLRMGEDAVNPPSAGIQCQCELSERTSIHLL